METENKYLQSISDEYKFVWYMVNKACTRTLINYFYSDLNIIEQYHPHVFKQSDNYYKFTVVRNPWDRLISAWKNKIVEKPIAKNMDQFRQYKHDFASFVHGVAKTNVNLPTSMGPITESNSHLFSDRHIKSQYTMIPVDVDIDVYKTENIHNDIKRICTAIKYPIKELPHLNKSNHSDRHDYYNDTTRAIVEDVYQKDIETFKYTFDE